MELNQNISTSAEEIANNIDLLTEILFRLPVKPLVKFKIISKQYLHHISNLLSNPQFCLSYTRHHHTLTALLLKQNNNPLPLKKNNNDNDATEFETVPLKQDTMPPKVSFFNYLNDPCIRIKQPNIRIKQSCNGLLLCSSNYNPPCLWDSIYFVCNPTTKQFKRLSFSFPSHQLEANLMSVNLAFDPLKSSHYKVICVTRLMLYSYICQINIYSSETDSWSQLENDFTASSNVEFSISVFFNGAVHWYSKDETSFYFDVDRECLNTMPMPNLAQRCYYDQVRYFGESRGCMHLIVTKWPTPSQFDVLEMAPDYSGWFVRYHVNLDAMMIAFPEIIWYRGGWYRLSVLNIIRAQKEEDSILVIFADNQAISYSFHDGTSKKLYVTRKSNYKWTDTFEYFEILTSV